MAEIKLTKNELRSQQNRLGQLQKYLPTLQLKKAMLQLEVHEARGAIDDLDHLFSDQFTEVGQFSSLFSDQISLNLKEAVAIEEVKISTENIAGVEVPIFNEVIFSSFQYSLFETPPWVDAALVKLRELVCIRAKKQVAQKKKQALENELREVSIRVNLFEKVLIPRAQKNIRKIKVFLGDQQLAAVSQAKVAKKKIEERKEERANAR